MRGLDTLNRAARRDSLDVSMVRSDCRRADDVVGGGEDGGLTMVKCAQS